MVQDERKFLLLGGTSFVGRQMVARLGWDRVIGTQHRLQMPGCLTFDATATDLGEIISDPSEIGHCFILYGDTMPDSCANDPEASRLLNVDSTKKVIDRLQAWDIPLTFTSTEFVFDGTSANSVEEDIAEPILLYGRQKLEVEQYLAVSGKPYIVMRLGKVFDPSGGNGKLFTDWIEAIERGERKIRCAVDQFFSPIQVLDVVEGLLLGAEKKIFGVYHLCGLERESRMDLLQMLVEEVRRFRPVEVELVPCSIDDFPMLERRPKDVSMKPDKLIAATGLSIASTRDVCRKIVENHYSGE